MARGKTQQPRPRCPICRKRRGTNKEDAQPDWLRRKLIESSPDFANTRREIVRICEPCNTYFARNYENPAAPLLKPLIDGEAVTLRAGEQALIGKWITKTALMRLLRLGRDPRLGSDSRALDAADKLRFMMERGMPPHATSVRIAKIDQRDSVLSEELPPAPDIRPRLVVSTFGAIGYLHTETLIGDPDVIRQLESERSQIPEEDEWFLRVWPPQITKVECPPPRTMGVAASSYLLLKWQPREATIFWDGPGTETTLGQLIERSQAGGQAEGA